MKNKIPAKDLAFAKEQLRFRQNIREYEQTIAHKNRQISDQAETIRELQDQLRSQEEWIERLLDFANLTPSEQITLKRRLNMQSATESLQDTVDTIDGCLRHTINTIFGTPNIFNI